ncbi:hypothetical protein EVAR_70021_1 [Eumeta japonica]|uniref:Uncharacterized protein n=1 Tax=Eumeta variegata TaxID=151549 RepID=A0A4C2AHC1_EUMVA|nr:hypothetical protein EVAR_70021_1 [Eumeta japonica]
MNTSRSMTPPVLHLRLETVGMQVDDGDWRRSRRVAFEIERTDCLIQIRNYSFRASEVTSSVRSRTSSRRNLRLSAVIRLRKTWSARHPRYLSIYGHIIIKANREFRWSRKYSSRCTQCCVLAGVRSAAKVRGLRARASVGGGLQPGESPTVIHHLLVVGRIVITDYYLVRPVNKLSADVLRRGRSAG